MQLLIRIILASALILGCSPSLAKPANISELPALFVEAASPLNLKPAGVEAGQAITSQKYVRLNPLLPSRSNMRLSLEGGSDIEIVFNALEKSVSGNTVTYIGREKNDKQGSSSILLSATDGVYAGYLRLMNGKSYRIKFVSDKVHLLQEFAVIQDGFCSHSVPVAAISTGNADSSTDFRQQMLSPDSGATIDILMAYTARARVQAGGKAAIESYLNLGVSHTNAAFQRSGVSTRLRLVHTVELAYNKYDPDLLNTLLDLRGKNDGFMDNVHALRDQFKADLVQLVVFEDPDRTGGLAFLYNQPAFDFQDSAFNVVKLNRLRAIPHEIGHQMGVDHGRFSGSTDIGLFSFSHGFLTATATTIPQFPQLTLLGIGSGLAIDYFSNPDITVGGRKIGISIGQVGEADARETINRTARTAANWRPGGDTMELPKQNVILPPINSLLLDD